MSTNLPQRVYALWRRGPVAARTRRHVWIGVICAAVLITTLAALRIQRRHDVVRVGYQLSRAAETLRNERETTRRLELERATLTAPERIRGLATQLGMVPVPATNIRVVPPRATIASHGRVEAQP